MGGWAPSLVSAAGEESGRRISRRPAYFQPTRSMIFMASGWWLA
jgi:hypothetical protein